MTETFPLIEVEGSPIERGRSYGRQARDRIARGIDLYKGVFATDRYDLDSIARHYLAELEKVDGRLVAELQGIAEGSEQSTAAIVALNARTELTAWDATPAVDECTAGLAMPARTSGGKLLHAQNWDWRPDCTDTAIVLRIRDPHGPDILTFCEAGQLARHGMNSAGLALTANGLQTSLEANFAGLPSPFARRRMLMSSTIAEAIGVLLNTPRSSSHNLMLSQIDKFGRGEAVNFEVTPHDAYWSLPEAGILTHANHFKHPAALARLMDVGLMRHPESLYRDRRLQHHLETDGSAISIETFKRGLADDFGAPHSICRRPATRPDGSLSATVASLIMDAAAGQMWIARAPYEGAPLYMRYGLAA